MIHTADRSKTRLDKWLWAARYFKTRSLAKAAIESGRVLFHPTKDNKSTGQRTKPSREIAVGDQLTIRRGSYLYSIEILELTERRGSASSAAALYHEAQTSVEARELAKSRRNLENLGLQVPRGKPSKSERRELLKLKQKP